MYDQRVVPLRQDLARTHRFSNSIRVSRENVNRVKGQEVSSRHRSRRQPKKQELIFAEEIALDCPSRLT